MFIFQSDRCRYGKLSEELENSFTKGNDDYPDNLVSAYHLINEYKNWQPRSAIPDSTGVAFAQKGAGKKNKDKSEDWKKDAICHECGEKGHIRPNCPKLKEESDDEAPTPKASVLKKKPDAKKKPQVSFATDGASKDADDDTESQFYNYGFCTTSSKINLRKMILLDNQFFSVASRMESRRKPKKQLRTKPTGLLRDLQGPCPQRPALPFVTPMRTPRAPTSRHLVLHLQLCQQHMVLKFLRLRRPKIKRLRRSCVSAVLTLKLRTHSRCSYRRSLNQCRSSLNRLSKLMFPKCK